MLFLKSTYHQYNLKDENFSRHNFTSFKAFIFSIQETKEFLEFLNHEHPFPFFLFMLINGDSPCNKSPSHQAATSSNWICCSWFSLTISFHTRPLCFTISTKFCLLSLLHYPSWAYSSPFLRRSIWHCFGSAEMETLDDYIYSRPHRARFWSLSWKNRLKIAVDVAYIAAFPRFIVHPHYSWRSYTQNKRFY